MTNKKENVNNQLNFNFLTSNIRGLESSKKRVKMLEYFKNEIGHGFFLILQETHSSIETEKQWNVNLRVNYIPLMVKPIHAVLLLHFAVM